MLQNSWIMKLEGFPEIVSSSIFIENTLRNISDAWKITNHTRDTSLFEKSQNNLRDRAYYSCNAANCNWTSHFFLFSKSEVSGVWLGVFHASEMSRRVFSMKIEEDRISANHFLLQFWDFWSLFEHTCKTSFFKILIFSLNLDPQSESTWCW